MPKQDNFMNEQLTASFKKDLKVIEEQNESLLLQNISIHVLQAYIMRGRIAEEAVKDAVIVGKLLIQELNKK